MNNIAIVTGASSGMGREFVLQISEKYKNLDEIWVIARRKDELNSLKDSIKNIKIIPVPVDITKEENIKIIQDKLTQTKPNIRILVNAAGYGIIGKFNEIDTDNSGMCMLNCVALTRMLDICLPYMDKKRSCIINMASAAAFSPQPSFATYAATKSYVLSLSTAINKELSKTGISVTAVCPGPVSTEFFDKAEIYHQVKLYKKMTMVKPEKVVSKALLDAHNKKHISVYGVSMKLFRFISKILPHNIIVKFIK